MKQLVVQFGRRCRQIGAILMVSGLLCCGVTSAVWAQSVSGVRSFDGGVGPLFNLTGPGNLYLDGQGTQGYLYTPGGNLETYNFRNPTTGQAWSGAVMTFGPQLSIGLIQGANQGGSPLVLPGPPRQTAPLPAVQSTISEDIPY
ncbi:MAG: hypothetical protein RI101_02775 [Nitrospira sp.]|jgi:hypothetical protein|nr:hypothetical protein [Nitrospira sp.]